MQMYIVLGRDFLFPKYCRFGYSKTPQSSSFWEATLSCTGAKELFQSFAFIRSEAFEVLAYL